LKSLSKEKKAEFQKKKFKTKNKAGNQKTREMKTNSKEISGFDSYAFILTTEF